MRVKLFNTCTGRSTSSNERLSCLPILAGFARPLSAIIASFAIMGSLLKRCDREVVLERGEFFGNTVHNSLSLSYRTHYTQINRTCNSS